jgi:hypothetical protein
MTIAAASAAAKAQAVSIIEQFHPRPEVEAVAYLPIKVWNLEHFARLPHPGLVRPSVSEWSARGPEPSVLDLLI